VIHLVFLGKFGDVAPAGLGKIALPAGVHTLSDLQHWIRHDRKIAARVLELVSAILRDPFGGIGKPEPLKFNRPSVMVSRLN